MNERIEIETLFVLGPANGHRLKVPTDVDLWRILKRKEPTDESFEGEELDEYFYTRRRLTADRQIVSFFAAKEASTFHAIEALLAHYPNLCNY